MRTGDEWRVIDKFHQPNRVGKSSSGVFGRKSRRQPIGEIRLILAQWISAILHRHLCCDDQGCAKQFAIHPPLLELWNLHFPKTQHRNATGSINVAKPREVGQCPARWRLVEACRRELAIGSLPKSKIDGKLPQWKASCKF